MSRSRASRTSAAWSAANRANWDARARAHLAGPGAFYPLDSVRAGVCSLLPAERELGGEVSGRRLLHLMCHIGLDSISWARRGAQVDAVDFSPAALSIASRLARACGVAVAYHRGDVAALPPACAGPFDVVVMTYGVLCWIADLPHLLRTVAARLAPGGRFVLVDEHPLVGLLAQHVDGSLGLDPSGEYFHRSRPQRCRRHRSYTGSTRLSQPVSHQWSHPLGEIIQAVVDAGLALRTLREERWGFYARFPGMRRQADGTWLRPGPPDDIPLVMALLAERPMRRLG